MTRETSIGSVLEFKKLAARNFQNLGYHVVYEPNEFPQIKLFRLGGEDLSNLVLYGTVRFESEPSPYSIGEGLVSRLTLTIFPDKDNPRIIYQYDRGRESGEITTPEKLSKYSIARTMYDHIITVIRIDPKKQNVRQVLQKPTVNTQYTPTSETKFLTPKKASEEDCDFELGPAKRSHDGIVYD
jgi:hypothetical protein